MDKKIRVLQINASTEYGGVSSMLFNIYKNIDRERFCFDFLSPNKTSFRIKETEIRRLGGKTYGLNVCDNKNKVIKFLKLYLRLKKHIKNNYYDIIHINSGSRIYNAIVSICCKRNSKAKIIIHSHNGLYGSSLSDRIARKIIERNADRKFSCSDKASKAMFEKIDDVLLIKNGINADSFCFNQKERNRVRTEFGISKDEKLIGNIGRMTTQKNQLFLLDVFNEARKTEPRIKLLIVGSGELEQEIRNKIEELGLAKNVVLTNNRNDMPAIYSALDVFALPSLYEGLPVSAIEAQYNGLPTLLSTEIDEKAKISTFAEFCELSDADLWRRQLIKQCRSNKGKITESYDIRDTSEMIEREYYAILG